MRQDHTLCWNLDFGDNAKPGQVAQCVKEIKEQFSAKNRSKDMSNNILDSDFRQRHESIKTFM